jgi:hypothetical protein
MFWFRGWMSERSPANQNRQGPYTRDQVGEDFPDDEKLASIRLVRLPWFQTLFQRTPPALAAGLVVAPGYWTGILCPFGLCNLLVVGTWIPGLLLVLIEAICSSDARWSGRPFRIGFFAYAVFLVAAQSSMSWFSWYEAHFWLILVLPLAAPLLVGGMVLHREKRGIGAAGAWLFLFSSVAMATFNATHNWDFVGFIISGRIRF